MRQTAADSPALLPAACAAHCWAAQNLPSRPRRNRRSETFRAGIRESWLSPSHFILPLFIHEEGGGNQPIASMPGINRLAYGKNVVDHVAEARSLGVNQVVIFPKVRGPGGP